MKAKYWILREKSYNVSEIISRFRGNAEWRLERMAVIIYEEALDGMDEADKKEGKKKGGPNRREINWESCGRKKIAEEELDSSA